MGQLKVSGLVLNMIDLDHACVPLIPSDASRSYLYV